MKKIDYYILSKENLINYVDGYGWAIYNFEEYFPNIYNKKYPVGSTDVLDDPEIFMPAIKNIINVRKRSFISKYIQPHIIVVYVIDDLNSTLRKRMILDTFMNMKFKKVFIAEIGPSAVSSNNLENYKRPSIVVTVIGKIIHLSFCFGGSTIIIHIIKSDFSIELREFEKRCNELQSRNLEECLNLDKVNEEKVHELNNIWISEYNYDYVLVSHDNFDILSIEDEFVPDYKVSFNQIIEIVNSNFGMVLKEINKYVKKQ